jgi:hypothetical protein
MVEFFEMLKPSGFGESRRLFVLRLSGVCFARFEFSKMLSFSPPQVSPAGFLFAARTYLVGQFHAGGHRMLGVAVSIHNQFIT